MSVASIEQIAEAYLVNPVIGTHDYNVIAELANAVEILKTEGPGSYSLEHVAKDPIAAAKALGALAMLVALHEQEVADAEL